MSRKSFNNIPDDATAPFRRWGGITPSDSVNIDLGFKVRSIHNSGTAGTCVVVSEDDETATVYLDQGGRFEGFVKRVNATGLTAGMTLVALG